MKLNTILNGDIMRPLLTTILIFLAANVSYGQPLTAWRVDDCMRYAVDNAPAARRAELAYADSRIDKTEAIASFFPSISAGTSVQTSFGRSIDPITNVYDNIANFNNSYSVSASVPLFGGLNVLNNFRIAKIATLQGKEEQARVEDQIALMTMQSFFDAMFAAENYRYALQNLEEKRLLLSQVKGQHSVGLKSAADVAQVEADVAMSEATLISYAGSRDMSMIKLKEQMNYPQDEELVLDSLFLDIMPSSPDRENSAEIAANALTFLPEARIADYNVRSSSINRTTALASLFPSLSLQGGYSTGYTRGINRNGSLYEPFREQFRNRGGQYVGMSLSIPIFSGLGRVSRYRRAGNALKSAEQTRIETDRRLESEIIQAVADLENAEKEYLQYLKGEEASRLSYEVTQAKYREGLLSFVDVQTTSTQYMLARINMNNARFRYHIKRRVVDYYKGEPYIR